MCDGWGGGDECFVERSSRNRQKNKNKNKKKEQKQQEEETGTGTGTKEPSMRQRSRLSVRRSLDELWYGTRSEAMNIPLQVAK